MIGGRHIFREQTVRYEILHLIFVGVAANAQVPYLVPGSRYSQIRAHSPECGEPERNGRRVHATTCKFPCICAGFRDIAIKAKDGEIWSQQRAITFVGNVDAVLDEISLFYNYII